MSEAGIPICGITSVVWHDARNAKPKYAGPFLCIDTLGNIFTQRYFPKAERPRWEKNSRTVLFWGDVEIPALPSNKECHDWELKGGHEQWVAYWSMKGYDVK